MAFESLTLEVVDQLLIITLDRPKANAIDKATSFEIYQAVVKLEEDPQLRVGIITGSGDRFFSAGWDLKAAAAGEAADADFGPGGFAGVTEFFGRTKPLIAAVNGLALGGGFELALACDLIVAAKHAEFGLPEVKLGLVADSGGMLRLPRLIPRSIALELLLTGRRLSATEAASLGIINQVVSASDLMDAATELGRTISTSAPLSVAAVLEVVHATEGVGIAEGFAEMRSGKLKYYPKVASSEDAVLGVASFAEKSTPHWKGR
ncbi:MAG TPA: enoyl-CoA hydratase-related protein [Candidatus Nanopelagicaceae bacterium]